MGVPSLLAYHCPTHTKQCVWVWGSQWVSGLYCTFSYTHIHIHTYAMCVHAEEALEWVETTKAVLAELRRRAAELKSGMDIFGIPQPAYKVRLTLHTWACRW